MKSEHRHELETNWLAHRVALWLEEVRPYYSLIAGCLLAAAALFFGYSYFSGETATRQSAAWNSYNAAVQGPLPNLETLRESAEEYPDSPMQQWADITWADGQVWMASRAYIQSRPAAMDALNRAASTYQSLLQVSTDERLKDRAHFGLGRAYELQNELDKAREEYGAVKGGFARLAEQRAKQLEEPEVKEAYAWLATAQAPRRALPTGAGTPGQRPDFSPGELEIPAGGTTTPEPGAAMTVDDLFQGIGEDGEEKDDPSVTDRYSDGNADTKDDASKPAESGTAEPKE
jgi:hypothetical protein